ncbi:MAG TPA: hypothetical protein VI636_16960 [Candidatus Angelobacter sp.]
MSPRKKSKTARTRYMMADFMPDEKEQVIQYCQETGNTISSFLAEIALEDLQRSDEPPAEEELEIKLRIPIEQSAKLQMFAHRRGKTPDEYVSEMVSPLLKKGQTSFHNPHTEGLRYYVSPEQHRRLKKYFKSKRLSPRTYVSYLVLKALKQRRKKKH